MRNIEKFVQAEVYANMVVEIEKIRFDNQIEFGEDGLKKVGWFKKLIWKNFNFKHKEILDYEYFLAEGKNYKNVFSNGG
jgi:hypothetical protein